MLEIDLGKGIKTLIDEDEAHRLCHVWRAQRIGEYIRVRRSFWKDGKNSGAYLHREILGVDDPKVYVDHINGDTLDNRKENLRLVDATINNRNRAGPGKTNKSGFLGVCKRRKGFTAYISVGGKQLRLGYFGTAEEANKARLEAEKTFWGIEPRRENAHGM